MSELTRHDIPETVKNVIKVAVAVDVIDIADVYCLGAKYAPDNWMSLVDSLIEYAYMWIHSDSSKHTAVVEAAEKFWQEVL